MTLHPVTIELPDAVYERLCRKAEQAHRTVQDELLDVVEAAVLADDKLSPEMEERLASLAVLDDTALWDAARTTIPAETSEELEQLHFKRQREGLTESEAQRAAQLLGQYERAMLVRAQAAALLKERGHDVSSLVRAA